MRFLSLLYFAAPSFAKALPTDALTDLYTKTETLQMLVDFNFAKNTEFSKADLAKVWPNLVKPDNIKNLLVNEKVSFSLEGLSIPEKEAKADIITAISRTKIWFNNAIKSHISEKTNPDSIGMTKAEFRKLIKELGKNKELKEKLVEKIDWIFTKHPEFASFIHYFTVALPETFDNEGLDYAKLFLAEVHECNPELVAQLLLITEYAQTKYDILPEAQSNKLKHVFLSLK
ncbi:hypothetical protein DSO57_1035042 [Entomophthora muscae]|uniref:Uncharacterized protein n=1 Tax=Entomophthora muscae TaxID=34485 RepID=A0ACC2SZN4_9FUNG|nr:hypothetical protein DSO57_1035042 [Entomophthora muscae]